MVNILTALRSRGVMTGKKPAGTAIPGDVRAGETFMNDNGEQVGTLVDRGNGLSITPGTAIIPIPAGIYNTDGGVAGDVDLVAANIKSGVNLFGVAGAVIEAIGNAVAADVLAGKTFSKAGTAGLSGTMVDRGTVNITPSTVNQAIAAGKHSGAGVVYGDPDLVAANILKDVNIFGVTGTALKVATGTFIPPALTYTQTISGLTFRPDIIILKLDDATINDVRTVYVTTSASTGTSLNTTEYDYYGIKNGRWVWTINNDGFTIDRQNLSGYGSWSGKNWRWWAIAA